MPFESVAEGIGGPHHIGRQEGRDDRHGNDDGVEIVVRYVERRAERGDDEGEFADLRERESRLDSHAQRLARNEHAERGEGRLSGEYYDGEQQNGADVTHEQRRFDHHAY